MLIAAIAATFLAVAWAEAAPPAQPAPVTAEAVLDKTHATIGDSINLTVTVKYEPGVKVSTDDLVDQFTPFEATAADPPSEQHNANGSGELKLRYRIAAYQTGLMPFPALSIPYSAGGQTGSVQTQAIPFTIDSVIPAGDRAADIRPLKPQLELPLPAAPSLRRLLAVAGAALLVVIAGAVVWRLLRPAPAPVPQTPSVEASLEAEAREELDRIVAEDYLGRGDYRTHYALLAACIRRYITRRYGFQASALTTSELSDRMVLSGVGRWRARLVAGLLTECDAVHYARYLPAPARADADVQMAYEIVDLALSQETRPDDARLEVGG